MAPLAQQAVLVTAFGAGSHDLHDFVSIGEVPVVPPGQGEVLVKMLLRPVNPAGAPTLGFRSSALMHVSFELHGHIFRVVCVRQITTASMALLVSTQSTRSLPASKVRIVS